MTTALHDYTVVLASAGTGKTFQLSNRFLSVLARDPSLDPAKLLATTFTRKAAGEILDRVIERLADAASNDAKAAALDGFLGVSLARPGYERLCVRLAGSLHRLAIQTIDAFTARVVGALGLDIGLPAGWRIAEDDEDARLRTEAVDAALRVADREEVFSLISLWHSGGFGRTAHGTLLDIINQVYEAFLLANRNPAPWTTIAPTNAPLEPAPFLAAVNALRNGDFTSAGTGKRSESLAKESISLAADLEARDWKAFVSSALVRNTLFGDASYRRVKLQPSLIQTLQVLGDHSAQLLVRNLANRNAAAFALIAKFDAAYQDLKARRGLYRFDDLPRYLLARPFEDLLTRLYFRLDAQVQHVLFDEFQDTSVLQFNLLRPVCDEILSQHDGTRTFLCVGDTKQSLYAWRGAKSQLLANVAALWPTIHTHQLSQSFRSSQTILDAVNTVFGSLPVNPILNLSPAGQDAAAEWGRNFQPHAAAKASLKGRVRLWSVEGDSAACFASAADRVQSILAEAPGASVGILVRANRGIPALIYELASRGISAAEEGSSLLTDSSPVAAVASLFHLADYPDDSASLFHVASSPLGALFDLTEQEMLPRHTRLDAGTRASISFRRRLSVEGFQRTTEWIVRRIASSVDDRGLRRLDQMTDLAVAFDRRRDTRPSDFARLLRSKRVADPVSRQVRVMTIHQSKGLEFDAVVLPDLIVKRNRPPAVLTDNAAADGSRSPFAPVSDVSLNPSEAVCDLHPRLRGLLRATTSARISEELSVLYVAMTRAIHSLDIILPSRASEPDTFSSADAACTAFGVSRVKAGSTQLLSLGTDNWYTPERQDHVERPVEHHRISLREPDGLPVSRWPRRSPSSLEGGPSRTLDSILTIEPTHGLERGTLVHAFCEAVDWLDTHAAPSEVSLVDLALSLGWSDADAHREAALFLHALRGPLASVFTRARYAGRGDVTLRREWAFATPALDHDERIMLSGQIDRLVVLKQGGRIVSAEVIDFKTDAVSPEGPDPAAFAARVEHYRPQLNAYRASVARLFSLPREAVRATLVFLAAGVEVTLES
ncbi:MAG: UvrD-helicase domain-containing protein [Phycisphaerales bacterium]